MSLFNLKFSNTRPGAIEMPYSDEWLPLADAAAIAKIPVKSLRKDIREGRIRAYGRPRRLRVRMADVLPPYTPPVARKAPQEGRRAAMGGTQ